MDLLNKRLNFYGYQADEITGHPNYANRRGRVFAITDRRTGRLVATYSTITQVKKWCDRHFGVDESAH